MALEVYVMPLCRFKAGDFASPMETTLGMKPQVVSLGEPACAAEEAPWHLRLLAKIGIIELEAVPAEPMFEERQATAQEEVARLKRQLSDMAGVPVDWPDTGEVHYARQFHEPVTLRAFAAWQDHREALPTFTAAPERNYYNHPVWQLPKPAERRFRTLVGHSLFSGYLLPVAFEGVHKVEPFKIRDHWEFFHDVASTHAILREVTELLEVLRAPAPTGEAPGCVPAKDVQWYAEELQRICELSLRHHLPVIFHG